MTAVAGSNEADFTPIFGLDMEQLRARRNSKWAKYGHDVIPAWIADMDCTTAPAVQAAIQVLVNQQDYGYPLRDGERADFAVSRAFCERMSQLYRWKTGPAHVQPLADLVQATFAALTVYSAPGEGVILQLPAYGPFHEAIHTTGRRLVPWHMRDNGEGWDGNIDALEALITEDTRILVLCNPQNPTGHVFSRAELEAIGQLVIRHNLVVLSDEVHCDILFDGRQHIPLASLSPAIAAHTVTLNSATKSFNIPGLRCAVVHFGSDSLRDRFLQRMPRRMLGTPSVFGIDATVAAWTRSDEWLKKAVAHLQDMRDLATEAIARDMPGIRCHTPEATYMAWLDCSALDLGEPAANFFLREAKVAFTAGEEFDPDRADFCRLNFATSRPLLSEILDRMTQALHRHSIAIADGVR